MKSVIFTNEQLSGFALAMEHLIHAGIGTADALNLLAEDERDPSVKKVLSRMASMADGGLPLSKIIEDSGAFPPYAVSVTEVGERSGKIEQTLNSLGVYYDRRRRMERAVRASLIYPTALLAVLVAVAAVLLVWVLPVFEDVYRGLGTELTGMAGVLLGLGRGLRAALPVILAVIALWAVVFAVPPVRRFAFALWSRGFGDRGAGRKVLSARFVHGICMAVGSGMNAGEAVLLACKLSEGETPAFAARCKSCLDAAETGGDLSAALWENGFISSADRRLLDAGRRSGREEDVLRHLTLDLQDEAEEALHRRAALMEPAVVALACILIAAVLLSVMLPLMNIMNAMG